MSIGLWFLLACFVAGCASAVIERAYQRERVRRKAVAKMRETYPWLFKSPTLPLVRQDRHCAGLPLGANDE